MSKKPVKNSKGHLIGVSLPAFAQLAVEERLTCSMSVRSGSKQGELYFEEGRLVGAETGKRQAEDAALEIFTWTDTIIMIEPYTEFTGPHIKQSLSYLMLEAMRIQDEKRKGSYTEKEIDFVNITDNSINADVILFENKKMFNFSNTEQKNIISKGELTMEIEVLEKGIEVLKSDLGGALIACDIFDSSGLSYIGFNPQPEATALFAEMTSFLRRALNESGFPALGNYYYIQLDDKKIVVVAVVEDFQWGMLVDGNKVNLGLLINIALPKVIKTLKSAI